MILANDLNGFPFSNSVELAVKIIFNSLHVLSQNLSIKRLDNKTSYLAFD